MNVDPKAWGKQYWFVLHTITFTYPDKPNDTAKRKYYDLIQNLPLFLPNKKIANQFAEILDKYPVKPYLDSKAMFVKWLHFIHNEINKLIGKEEMSYNLFLDIMNQRLSSPLPPPKTLYTDQNMLCILFILFVCGIIFLETRRKTV